MAAMLITLAIAASASAQFTTSMLYPKNGWYPEKVGLAGSVIAAADGLTTVSLAWDDGVASSALSIGEFGGIVTLGPKTIGYSGSSLWGEQGCSLPGDGALVCSLTYAPEYVRQNNCRPTGGRSYNTETSFSERTFIHTYPARLSYSSGVETVTETATYAPVNTTHAEWCTWDGFTPEPVATTSTLSAEKVQTMQLILTAGLEKINVTATPTPTTSGTPEPTASQTSGLPEATNAAERASPGLYELSSLGLILSALLV